MGRFGFRVDPYEHYMAVALNWGVLFMEEASYLGVYTRVPDIWKLPYGFKWLRRSPCLATAEAQKLALINVATKGILVS